MNKKSFFLIIIALALLVSGCGDKIKEPTLNEKKEQAITKLKEVLTEKGYKAISENEYKFIDFENGQNEDGTPVGYQYYTFNFNDMTYEREMKTKISFLVEEYSIRNNTATGFVSSYMSIINYTYDFNNGSNTCDIQSCSTYISNLLSLKNNISSIIKNADIDIELVK